MVFLAAYVMQLQTEWVRLTAADANGIPGSQASVLLLQTVSVIQRWLCHVIGSLAGGSDCVNFVKRWRIRRGDAVECVWIGLQGMLPTVECTDGPTFKGPDQFDIITTDEFADGVVVLTGETCWLVSSDGDDSDVAIRYDGDLSEPTVGNDPTTALALGEPLKA